MKRLSKTNLAKIKKMVATNYIAAIKEVRHLTGCGLKEAYDFVSELRAKLPVKRNWKGPLNAAEEQEWRNFMAKGWCELTNAEKHRWRNLRSRKAAMEEAKLPAYVITQSVYVREEPEAETTLTGCIQQDLVHIESGVFLDQEKADAHCKELNDEAEKDPTQAEQSTGEPRYTVKAVKLTQ